ncbi:MAG: NAD(P)-dependent oxidoreductase [Crenarchaeota archaeon]|nr:MAG: NAD(P)-dependent oxidoreductase [Thermoproteota archaeon]
MNILVTGGTGFIGSNLTRALLAAGHRVSITGNHNENTIPDGIVKLYVPGLTGIDWTSLAKEKIDAVFHLAANNYTQDEDEIGMLKANLDGPSYLFNFLYDWCGCKKFIFASSAAVYGSQPTPFVENHTRIEPLTPYGRSKAMFDDFAMKFAKNRRGVSAVGLRYCNVFGAGESHKQTRSSMIYQIIGAILSKSKPSLFQGSYKRDWIYIDDVVKANLKALDWNGVDIFNCAGGISISFEEIVQMVCDHLGLSVDINWIDNPIKDTYQSITQCNIDRIKKHLKFQPSDFKTNLIKCIDMITGDALNMGHPACFAPINRQ